MALEWLKRCFRFLCIGLIVCFSLKEGTVFGKPSGAAPLGTFNSLVDDDRFSFLGNTSMWLGGGMITEFNDNITLDPDKGQSDIILRPNFYCRALKPLTEKNELNFIGRAGFTRYLKHSQYNSNFITISPDTALSFTFYLREIECMLTDQFSYLQDATTSPLINRTISYKRFENTLSLTFKWPMSEKALGSAAFSRGDTIADSKEFKSLSKTVYKASCSGSYRVFNALWLGASVSGHLERYKQAVQNDNKGLSLSLDLRATLSEYLSTNASLGWDRRTYESDGSINDAHQSISSFTLKGSLEHRITPYTQHSLTLSSVPQSGFGSNFYTDTQVTYLIRTQLSQKVSSALNLIYQYTKTSHIHPEKSHRYFILRCHYKPLLLYKKEGGSVKTTKAALTHVAQELCQSLGLSQCRVKVNQKGQRLCWDIYFTLSAEENLPQLVETLQTRLNQSLQVIFGIEKLGPITVIVNGFKGSTS